jgi:hypothetical protein
MITREHPTSEQLTRRQLMLARSYSSRKRNQHDHLPTLPILPEHGFLTISDEELSELENGEQIPQEFQGQPDLTIDELSQAAQALLSSPAWEKLYGKESIPADPEALMIVQDLEEFFYKQENSAKKKGIRTPLLDPYIRQVLTTIFSRLPQYDADSVYKILSASRAYGLFHRFCTQSFPTSINNNQIHPHQRKITRIFKHFFPNKLGNLQAEVIKIQPDQLGSETLWKANDQETRIRLANEMFVHVQSYLLEHPDEHIIIVEPGGGNAELSVILAQQLAINPITTGKAKIVVREISQEMAEEGKDKIEQIEINSDLELDIDYIIGSADHPLREDLFTIQQAINDNNHEILSQFGLSMEEALFIIADTDQRKIIGGISTYTAGAMSRAETSETAATRVFTSLTKEVQSEDGLIIINDFSTIPPDEVISSPSLPKEKRETFRQLKKTDRAFQQSGLNKGLAVAYGLWGTGVGHDIRQIWKVRKQLSTTGIPVDITTQQRNFALLPTPLPNRYLKIPGFIETTLRCSGTAQDSTIHLAA